jgi:diguanylate cyclase (GGDEF)-like protein
MPDFWTRFSAPVLIGVALLLALAFHRNRAVLLLSILACVALAFAGFGGAAWDQRAGEAVRMFAPWLLLVAAVLPERRLRARRNLFLLAMLALAVWIAAAAPAQLWTALRQALPLGWLPWSAASVASALIVLAAAVCLLRWWLQRPPLDLALGCVLLLTAIALQPALSNGAASDLLLLAAVLVLVAILHAVYRMAFVDGLAGLPNRRALDEALQRLSGDYVLAMVDVDHFKAFNDRHGHGAGDRALKAIAAELAATRAATAYRYGGEEFCLLFADGSARSAKAACEELRERVAGLRIAVRAVANGKRTRRTARAPSDTVKVTISIGLAQRGKTLHEAVDVLKAADKALYKAKANGRNRVVAG